MVLKRHKKARYGRCEVVKLQSEMNGSGRAAPNHSGWAASRYFRARILAGNSNFGGKFKFLNTGDQALRTALGTENPTENGLTVTSQRDRDACDATGHVRFWFSMSWKNEREWQMNVNIHLSGWLFQNEVYNSIMCKETTYSVLLRVLSHSSPYLRGFFGKIVQLLIQSASYGDINDYYLK